MAHYAKIANGTVTQVDGKVYRWDKATTSWVEGTV